MRHKTMKKALSLLLVLSMTLGVMSTTAFARDDDKDHVYVYINVEKENVDDKDAPTFESDHALTQDDKTSLETIKSTAEELDRTHGDLTTTETDISDQATTVGDNGTTVNEKADEVTNAETAITDAEGKIKDPTGDPGEFAPEDAEGNKIDLDAAQEGVTDALEELAGAENPTYDGPGDAETVENPGKSDVQDVVDKGFVDTVKDAVNDLNGAVQETKAQVEAGKQAAEDAKAELETKKAELEASSENVSASIETLKGALDSAKSDAQTEIKKANDAAAACEEQKKTLEENFNKRLEALGDPPTEPTPRLASDEDYQDYLDRYNEWRKQYDEYNATLGTIRTEYNTEKGKLEDQSKVAQGLIDSAKDKIIAAENALKALNDQNTANFTSLTGEEAYKTLEAYKEALALYNTAVGTNEKPGAYNAAAEAFNTAVSGYEAVAKAYNEYVTAYNDEAKLYNGQIADYKEAVNGYTEAVTDYKTAVENHGTAVTEYKESVEEYQGKVTDYVEDATAFNQAVDVYEEQVKVYNEKADAYNQDANNWNKNNVSTLLLNQVAEVAGNDISIYNKVTDILNEAGTSKSSAALAALTEEDVLAYNRVVERYNTAVADYNSKSAKDRADAKIEQVSKYFGGEKWEGAWYAIGTITVAGDVFSKTPNESGHVWKGTVIYRWNDDGTREAVADNAAQIADGGKLETALDKPGEKFETHSQYDRDKTPGYKPTDDVYKWELIASDGANYLGVNSGTSTWHLNGYLSTQKLAQLATLEVRAQDAVAKGYKDTDGNYTHVSDQYTETVGDLTENVVSYTEEQSTYSSKVTEYQEKSTEYQEKKDDWTERKEDNLFATEDLKAEANSYTPGTDVENPITESTPVTLPDWNPALGKFEGVTLDVTIPDDVDIDDADLRPTTPTPTPITPTTPTTPTGGGGGDGDGDGETTITEDPTPLAETPEEVEIPPEEVPLAEEPEEEPEEVEIPEEDVPLADVPKTGDISSVWYFFALLSAAGLLVLTVEERKERRTNR